MHYSSGRLFLYHFMHFLEFQTLFLQLKSRLVTRQLCYEDVLFTPHSVNLYLKWAKNLQKMEQSHVVSLPKMKTMYLCPCEAILALVKHYKDLGCAVYENLLLRIFFKVHYGVLKDCRGEGHYVG